MRREDVRQTLLYALVAVILAIVILLALQHPVSRTFIPLPTPTNVTNPSPTNIP